MLCFSYGQKDMVTIPTASGKRDLPRGCRLTTLGVSGLDLDDCSSHAMCLISAIFTGSCCTVISNDQRAQSQSFVIADEWRTRLAAVVPVGVFFNLRRSSVGARYVMYRTGQAVE
jgi:hypothetical protein